ncbi:unnamed protein product [Ambrosiozyma monospora]|uniref:Unnamed protein product n=1 Tax=Ambrosiozyma monospora TaxID=43982 RepID=A0A9W7DJW4_AMBMO|nr:unnamed protein product [Ambrosiozyma monospora]
MPTMISLKQFVYRSCITMLTLLLAILSALIIKEQAEKAPTDAKLPTLIHKLINLTNSQPNSSYYRVWFNKLVNKLVIKLAIKVENSFLKQTVTIENLKTVIIAIVIILCLTKSNSAQVSHLVTGSDSIPPLCKAEAEVELSKPKDSPLDSPSKPNLPTIQNFGGSVTYVSHSTVATPTPSPRKKPHTNKINPLLSLEQKIPPPLMRPELSPSKRYSKEFKAALKEIGMREGMAAFKEAALANNVPARTERDWRSSWFVDLTEDTADEDTDEDTDEN